MNPLELIDSTVTEALLAEASASPRGRAHKLYHQGPHDPVQRMVVAVQRDSYIRPHRHPGDHKWEWLQMVRGKTTVLLFDDAGRLTDRLALQAGGNLTGLQLSPNRWHALVADEPCVFLEVKAGPFVADIAAEFADWAPAEGGDEATLAVEQFRTLQPGETFHAS